MTHNSKTTPTTWTTTDGFVRREHLGQPWGAHWRRFEADMQRLGLEVHELTSSPLGWGGPAVTVWPAQVHRVERGTRVRLDRHVEDEHVVLYPAAVWTLLCGHEVQVVKQHWFDRLTCPVCGRSE
jgi:hypothetical protein